MQLNAPSSCRRTITEALIDEVLGRGKVVAAGLAELNPALDREVSRRG